MSTFLRINMPYGMKKNNDNTWLVFNREYLPLGWNKDISFESIHSPKPFSEYPVHSYYKGLTNDVILSIIGNNDLIQYDDNKEISLVFFYNDSLRPNNNEEHWHRYTDILHLLSKYEVVSA